MKLESKLSSLEPIAINEQIRNQKCFKPKYTCMHEIIYIHGMFIIILLYKLWRNKIKPICFRYKNALFETVEKCFY